MRVTHVVPTPFGNDGLFGGGERYPLELARALARHVECELVTFGRSAHLERDSSGLRIRTLPTLTWLHGHPAQPLAPGLPAALAKANVIHTHHMRSLPSKIASVTGRLRGARLVVTDHGLQGGSWGGLLPRLFHLFLLVSAYSARELRAPAGRARVIYGGADPHRYAPDPLVARDGVLFVGRLTPHKGVDRLLAALPEGVMARLVGTPGHDPRPPERDYPDLLHTLASVKDVEFLESVSDDDLPRLYRSAHVSIPIPLAADVILLTDSNLHKESRTTNLKSCKATYVFCRRSLTNRACRRKRRTILPFIRLRFANVSRSRRGIARVSDARDRNDASDQWAKVSCDERHRLGRRRNRGAKGFI